MASASISPADLKARSDGLDRRVRLRNAVEYGACAVVVTFSLVAGVSAVRSGVSAFPDVLNVLGLFALGAGALVVALMLHFKTDPKDSAADAALPGLERLRARLARQRDALHTVWLWYVMPFVPGIALIYAAGFVANSGSFPWILGVGALATIALGVGITILNRRAAARLSEEIAALDTLAEE